MKGYVLAVFFLVIMAMVTGCGLGAEERIILNPGAGEEQQISVTRTEYDQTVRKIAKQATGIETQTMELFFYSRFVANLGHIYLHTENQELADAWNSYAERFNDFVSMPNTIKVGIFEDPEHDSSDGADGGTPLHIDIDTQFLSYLDWTTYAFLVERSSGNVIVLYPQDYGASFRMVNYAGLAGFRAYEQPNLSVHDFVIMTETPTGFQNFAKYTLDLSQTSNPVNESLGWPTVGHAWAFASATGPIRTLVPFKVGQTIYAKPELNEATGAADLWEAAEVMAISYEVIHVRFERDGREGIFHWLWFTETQK